MIRYWHPVEQTGIIFIDDIEEIHIHLCDKKRDFVMSVNVSDIIYASDDRDDYDDKTEELEVSVITEYEEFTVGLRFNLNCREERILCDRIECTEPYGAEVIMPQSYANSLNLRWLLVDYHGYRLMLKMDGTSVQTGDIATRLVPRDMDFMNANEFVYEENQGHGFDMMIGNVAYYGTYCNELYPIYQFHCNVKGCRFATRDEMELRRHECLPSRLL